MRYTKKHRGPVGQFADGVLHHVRGGPRHRLLQASDELRAILLAAICPRPLLPPETLLNFGPHKVIHHIELRAPLGDVEGAEFALALRLQPSAALVAPLLQTPPHTMTPR